MGSGIQPSFIPFDDVKICKSQAVARFGCILLALSILICSVRRFLDTPFVSTFASVWIPGYIFLAGFVGGALITTGVVLNKQTRLSSIFILSEGLSQED